MRKNVPQFNTVEEAQAHFGDLLRRQQERVDKVKQEGAPIDYGALDTIIIGVLGGDGIGPSIARESQHVLEDLLADEAPVAIATGPDQAVTGDDAEMDGGASYDLDGDRLDVVWSLLSVPEASAVTDADLIEPTRVSSSFVPDVVGDYTLLLVVDDGQRTSTDVVVVTAIGRYQGCSALPGQPGGRTLLFSLLVALAWGVRRRDQCATPGGPGSNRR